MKKTTIIYFDTNFFYHIVDSVIPKNSYKKLQSYLLTKKIKAYYTPITFNEIAKHISNQEKNRFDYYKRILIEIKWLCGDNIFEYPDYTLAQILKVPPRPMNKASDLNKFRDLICSYKSYKQLVKTDNFRRCGGLLAEYHNLKSRWVQAVDKFLREINPQYSKRRQRGKTTRITNKKTRNELILSLNSDKFNIQFVDAILYKATNITDNSFIGLPTNQAIQRIIEKMSAYYAVYKTIAKKVIVDGYCVDENDFDDVHLLIYLGLGHHIRFISYDDKLKQKISECSHKKQVMTIEDLLTEE